MHHFGKGNVVGTGKVEVFEDEKHKTGGNDADNEADFSPSGSLFPTFHQNPARVVDKNGDKKNEDVFGNEPHVEEAAGRQQHGPSEPVGEQIEQYCDDGQKNEKFNGVEYHISISGFVGAKVQILVEWGTWSLG